VFSKFGSLDCKGVRVGWLGDLSGYLPMERGVLELCAGALKQFADLGCKVDLAQPTFSMPRLWECWQTLRHWSHAATLADLYAKPDMRARIKPEAIWEIEGGLALSATEVSRASVTRSEWYQTLRLLFQRFDFLLLPSAQVFPFDAQQRWPTEISGRSMDTYHRWMEVVIGPTLAGLPAISVPIGLNAEGLPMGMQIIGPAQADWAVLRIAAAFEEVTRWTKTQLPALLGP
jgi:amidase